MSAVFCAASFAATLLAATLAAAGSEQVEVGGAELDYVINCQGCHLADGRATGDTVPALSGSVARFLRVDGGREFLVQVPGVAQAPLDDAATAGVLNWLLRRFDPQHLPVEFVPYSAGEVGRLRRSPLTDVERTRRRLLTEIEGANPG